MFTDREYKKLARILDNLYICSNVKFALMDESYRQFYTASYKIEFCELIAKQPGGYERCIKCDRAALVEVTKNKKTMQYRCHTGLIEVAVPVLVNDEISTIILFGQMLDNSSLEEQWQKTKELCSWYPDLDELYNAFIRIKRLSKDQIRAYSEIVQSCVSEVRLSGIVEGSHNNEVQVLESFINTYYSNQDILNLACKTLKMGKTKIYQICKENFNMSFGELVLKKRMDEAEKLLLETNFPVYYIAQIVGIEDSNYFTKLFKKCLGVTPVKYRKNKKDI
ncbi:MAG: helix-turn-helix domain-containing protein [Christensenellaceae bacterium]|nr:helix-turn-helix domain-containing protein [Christensenellaceae bacterium]